MACASRNALPLLSAVKTRHIQTTLATLLDSTQVTTSWIGLSTLLLDHSTIFTVKSSTTKSNNNNSYAPSIALTQAFFKTVAYRTYNF